MLKPIESADRSLPREIIILGFRGRADAENCSPTVSLARKQGFQLNRGHAVLAGLFIDKAEIEALELRRKRKVQSRQPSK